MVSIHILICFYFFSYKTSSATYPSRLVQESFGIRDAKKSSHSPLNEVLWKRALKETVEVDIAFKLPHGESTTERLGTQGKVAVPHTGQNSEECLAAAESSNISKEVTEDLGVPKLEPILKSSSDHNGQKKPAKKVIVLFPVEESSNIIQEVKKDLGVQKLDQPILKSSPTYNERQKAANKASFLLPEDESSNTSQEIKKDLGVPKLEPILKTSPDYNGRQKTPRKVTFQLPEKIPSGSDSPPHAQTPRYENHDIKPLTSILKVPNSPKLKDNSLHRSAHPDKQPLLLHSKNIILGKIKLFGASSKRMNIEHKEKKIEVHEPDEAFGHGKHPQPKCMSELMANPVSPRSPKNIKVESPKTNKQDRWIKMINADHRSGKI